MIIEIKQNWSNGAWFVRPACAESRLVLNSLEKYRAKFPEVPTAI